MSVTQIEPNVDPSQNGMYAPLATCVLNVNESTNPKTYTLDARIAVLSKKVVNSMNVQWYGEGGDLSCYVVCTFGASVNPDNPDEAKLYYIDSTSGSNNYSIDLPIYATVYTALPDEDMGSTEPPAKTSRGTVVRVQTGSGGL